MGGSMTEKCPWNKCGLPATENRPYPEEQRGGLFGWRRLSDKMHDMWFCPKHARWHDHPEEQQPEVPAPYFVDGIKVAEVDPSFDYDGMYAPHTPSEDTADGLAERGEGGLRVRFWRENPGNNGYQSFDLAGCDVVEAMAWANKRISAKGDEFERGTFEVGVFIKGDPEDAKDLTEVDVGPDRVIWVYGENPLMG